MVSLFVIISKLHSNLENFPSTYIKVFAFMVSGFKSLPISFDLLQNKTGSVRIYHCICLKIVSEKMVIYSDKNENFFSPLLLKLRLMLLQFIRQTGFLGRNLCTTFNI